jgi:1,4-alpha-glucan branching enzyme
MSATEVLTTEHIDDQTPMGGNLLHDGGGATFRVWAPAAREVQILWGYHKTALGWEHERSGLLQHTGNGIWAGFVPDLKAGERYRYHVVGPVDGSEGLKRAPYDRDLSADPKCPDCHCLLADPQGFPWHDENFRAPAFHKLVIYQLHVGVWSIGQGRSSGTFLDVAEKLPYLRSLGINAIQPLPIMECPGPLNAGGTGLDYFLPKSDYGIKDDDPGLTYYLESLNQLLHGANPLFASYRLQDIQGIANQLKVLIDLCHVYGIAVILDVAYKHGAGNLGVRSLNASDREAIDDRSNSDGETDDGLAFAYWNDDVKQYLINNAKFWLQEYHCDGFRYIDVSAIKNSGDEHGWRFCQYVTDTCRFIKPEAIHIAESFPVEAALVSPTGEGGAGFDATQNDGLRDAVRLAISQASAGAEAFVDMDSIARELASPALSEKWRAVQCTENHSSVYKNCGWRLPKLADSSNPESWYASSRSRVALGLTMTALGIPHIFMGQEFLEDREWHDRPDRGYSIGWERLTRAKVDFLHFTRALIKTRNALPGLTGDGINVFHVHNENRVLAFHRWRPGIGDDVVVVISLSDTSLYQYQLGFPMAGLWRERFNSDIYDNWFNPWLVVNRDGINASWEPLHDLPASATLAIPANSILILALA